MRFLGYAYMPNKNRLSSDFFNDCKIDFYYTLI